MKRNIRVPKITYKPGYEVKVDYLGGTHWEILVVAHDLPDADPLARQGKHILPIQLNFRGEARGVETPEQLRKAIADTILQLEEHELREWLRFDGARWEEPHKYDWRQ